MRKILVIGAAESIFVRDFVRQYAKQNVVVDVLSLSDVGAIEGARNQLNCVGSHEGKFGIFRKHLSLFFSLRKALSELERNYDSIVIHYVHFFLAPHILFLRKMSNNIVTVVWGSDFYRIGNLQGLLQNLIYFFSRSIVFTNPKTRIEFEERKRFLGGVSMEIARFGLPVLDEINKIKKNGISRKELCGNFSLPADKVIVFAGYNANPAQRQVRIVEQFSELDHDVRQAAHLVFPLGYGDKNIESEIRKVLRDNGIENFSVLTKFYGFSDVAKLRCITDVLINIQPSDQFSGSMQETLYAGGRVVAGQWLPYEDIIEAGAEIRLVEREESIGPSLAEEIKCGIKLSVSCGDALRESIDNSSTWDGNIRIWNRILFGQDNYCDELMMR